MTTKAAILKAIREKCLDCCCGNSMEVSLCSVAEKCPLHTYRTGKDPNPARKGNIEALRKESK